MAPARIFQAGDALRALAALSVAVYHFAYFAVQGSEARGFDGGFGEIPGHAIGALELGLYVFFVLSGYLIAGPFVRAFVEGSAFPRVRDYARNRFLRIVPPLWVVFTVLWVVHGTYGASWDEMASIYLFAQTYNPSIAAYLVGPAWTLGVELAFYALVPLAAWGAVRLARGHGDAARRRRMVLALAAGVWVASIALRELGPESEMWRRSPPALLFAFMPGVALAALQTGVRGVAAPGRIAGGLLGGALALYAVYAATVPAAFPPVPGVGPAVLASLGSGMLVAAPMVLEWAGRSPGRVATSGVARWLGERSYGLYLIHQGVIVSLLEWGDLGTRPWPRLAEALAIGLPASLALAALLHVAVERPLMRRRHAWRRQAFAPAAG